MWHGGIENIDQAYYISDDRTLLTGDLVVIPFGSYNKQVFGTVK